MFEPLRPRQRSVAKSFCSSTEIPGLQSLIWKPAHIPGTDEVEPFISCHLIKNLLDDAHLMLRTLSFVTRELLDVPQFELSTKSIPEVFEALQWHKQALNNLEKSVAESRSFSEMDLAHSAWRLCCLSIIHKRMLHDIMYFGKSQAPGLFIFQFCFDKLRFLVRKRLILTLEEENSIETYREEVYRREQKAIKEHTALAEQLKKERAERAQKLAQFQADERQAYQANEDAKAYSLAMEQQLYAECKAIEDREVAAFQAQEKQLLDEINKLAEALDDQQRSNRDMEMSLRGKKEQSVEEVTALLNEYDADIYKRTEDLRQVIQEHAEIVRKIGKYTTYFDEVARLEGIQGEGDRVARKMVEIKVIYHITRNNAARRIQRCWKKYRAWKKEQARKAAKKAKKAKKGKKGKGKKGAKDDKAGKGKKGGKGKR